MGYFAFIALTGLAFFAWPAAVPWLLAYFIIGMGIGTFVRWAALNHPSQKDSHIANVLFWWNFYAWPWGILAMLYFTFKKKGP